MHLTFQRKARTGAFAVGALAAVLVSTGPAKADDLAVKNNSDVPVKVVVKNGSTEVGHAEIYKRSSGKVTLNPGVSLAKITPTVEVTPIGASTRCSAAKSGSQYEIKCDPVAASAPSAPAGGGSATTAAKRVNRNLEIQNDLKDAVTVYFHHMMDGESIRDEHDISSHGSATFTIPVDEKNQMSEFNVIRHMDMERVPCGVQMRYDIPTSQQKVYVTPADGGAPPPNSEKRKDSKPCVLSPSSRIEKADATPAKTPPPATSGGATATKFVVENDLKDPVQISTLSPFAEEHTIGPKQSVTFDHPVAHPDGKSETTMEIYISRSVNMRLINCGIRMQYAIPPMSEVKFFVTRVAGSEWPPKAKPGEEGGGGGGGAKGGGLPPAPTCELTRSQNFEK